MRFGICSNVGLPLAARHPEALETLDHDLEGGLERLKLKRLSLRALGATSLLGLLLRQGGEGREYAALYRLALGPWIRPTLITGFRS